MQKSNNGMNRIIDADFSDQSSYEHCITAYWVIDSNLELAPANHSREIHITEC